MECFFYFINRILLFTILLFTSSNFVNLAMAYSLKIQLVLIAYYIVVRYYTTQYAYIVSTLHNIHFTNCKKSNSPPKSVNYAVILVAIGSNSTSTILSKEGCGLTFTLPLPRQKSLRLGSRPIPSSDQVVELCSSKQSVIVQQGCCIRYCLRVFSSFCRLNVHCCVRKQVVEFRYCVGRCFTCFCQPMLSKI